MMKLDKIAFLVALLFLVGCASNLRENALPVPTWTPTEEWVGKVGATDIVLRIVRENNEIKSAYALLPELSKKRAYVASEIMTTDTKLTIRLPDNLGRYEGVWNNYSKIWNGTLYQGPNEYLLHLMRHGNGARS